MEWDAAGVAACMGLSPCCYAFSWPVLGLAVRELPVTLVPNPISVPVCFRGAGWFADDDGLKPGRILLAAGNLLYLVVNASPDTKHSGLRREAQA